ncbi:MAG TPA: hypothetical protein VF310_05470 [Vicinamibacteria bacterium]
MQDLLARAAVSGVIGLVIGLLLTVVVAQLSPMPWDLRQSLINVGFACFFTGFFSWIAAVRQSRTGGAIAGGRPEAAGAADATPAGDAAED